MLEFEVFVDRNNFKKLQNLEIKCKIPETTMVIWGQALTLKVQKNYFSNDALHSLSSECTVSANGVKLSNIKGNYAHKAFIETEFSSGKTSKDT